MEKGIMIQSMADTGSAVAENIKRLIRTAAADDREEFSLLNKEFTNIYSALPKFAERLLDAYVATASSINLDVKDLGVYMVGGRVKGKPISQDSDIDIFIVTDTPDSSIESLKRIAYKNNCSMSQAKECRMNAMKSIRASIDRICNDLGIPNKFDVLSFGSRFPKEELLSSDKHILIGIRS